MKAKKNKLILLIASLLLLSCISKQGEQRKPNASESDIVTHAVDEMVTDYGKLIVEWHNHKHPVYAAYELEVFIQCKDSHERIPIELEYPRVCFYNGVSRQSSAEPHVIALGFEIQGKPLVKLRPDNQLEVISENDSICNDPKIQFFNIKEACSL